MRIAFLRRERNGWNVKLIKSRKTPGGIFTKEQEYWTPSSFKRAVNSLGKHTAAYRLKDAA